jgi:hypothetical protein
MKPIVTQFKVNVLTNHQAYSHANSQTQYINDRMDLGSDQISDGGEQIMFVHNNRVTLTFEQTKRSKSYN